MGKKWFLTLCRFPRDTRLISLPKASMSEFWYHDGMDQINNHVKIQYIFWSAIYLKLVCKSFTGSKHTLIVDNSHGNMAMVVRNFYLSSLKNIYCCLFPSLALSGSRLFPIFDEMRFVNYFALALLSFSFEIGFLISAFYFFIFIFDI